ncbi:hypothetical protein, partial [Burkholderia sp. SIMBA_051]|uniref:hypothetical protein n=1 Tax=Burkholderia sp. SIMBA_051 TaxID=3085792 RepID=UPI00397BC3D7
DRDLIKASLNGIEPFLGVPRPTSIEQIWPTIGSATCSYNWGDGGYACKNAHLLDEVPSSERRLSRYAFLLPATCKPAGRSVRVAIG